MTSGDLPIAFEDVTIAAGATSLKTSFRVSGFCGGTRSNLNSIQPVASAPGWSRSGNGDEAE